MTIIFPSDLVKDIKDGGYNKETKEKEGDTPVVPDDPDPSGGGEGGSGEDEPTPVTPVVVNTDYNALTNKPKIMGEELVGDKTFLSLGLVPISAERINEMWNFI